MGMIYAKVKIKKDRNSKKEKLHHFLIDSGATHTFVDKDVLKELGIKPTYAKSFYLANGEPIKRRLGLAYFEYGGQKGEASVVFAEEGDENLLGITTLEELGLGLNPIQREIVPLILRA